MNKRKTVTIKEIAEKTGTSVSTVHRVLHNKEGVGKELRKKILQVSDDLGYTVNYLASGLKRKPTRIASVFPNESKETKYFTQYILKGFNDCKKDLSNFNLEFEEIYFEFNESALFEVLNNLFKEKVDELDGLILTPFLSVRVEALINRFCDRGVSVVLIDEKLENTDYISCVKANNVVAGKMAGELLGNYLHKKGKVIVATGDKRSVQSKSELSINGQHFEQMLRLKYPDIEVEYVDVPPENNLLYQKMVDLLREETNIVGLYATSARTTVSMANALFDTDLQNKVKLIGSELFEENMEMLKKGVIDTIIFKNPYHIGYQSLQTMFDFKVKNIQPKKTYEVNPKMILRSNLEIELSALNTLS